MSNEDAGMRGSRAVPEPAMAEVLRLVRDMSEKIDRQGEKIDRQDKELVDIKLKLERGAGSIEAATSNGKELRKVQDELIELRTKFAILWAAVGVAGTAGITGSVMAAISLIKG
jgi:t-SNARE complex subunit (syntaxin)